MRIRTQLALSLGGMLSLSFVVAVVSIAVVLKGMVLSRLQKEQRGQVEMLASVSQQALVLKDELFMLNYVRLLRASPAISYAYFVDTSGRMLVHTSPEFVYQPEEKWTRRAGPAKVDELETRVVVSGRPAGTARIGFSRDYTWLTLYQAWREVITPLTWIAAAGVALSLLLGLALATVMTRSIRELLRGSEEIGKGHLTVEVPVTSSNELGELARQFNAMARQLQRLDELKAEFISVVSHDLRSPMGAIIAYSDYLLSGEIGALAPAHVKAIETIKRQCHHLTNMVNNILDMGKLQSGKMEFLREPFDAAKVISEVCKLFEVTASQRKLTLAAAAAPGCPLALGDSEKIQQVVTNLLSNALKFTPAGGAITLAVQPAPREEAVLFTVRDTGRGIPPEELPRMFERFHQVNALEQRAQKIVGTGLGLAICKAVVESLGGRIWVESKLDAGTAFHFTLPRARTAAPAPRASMEVKT